MICVLAGPDEYSLGVGEYFNVPSAVEAREVPYTVGVACLPRLATGSSVAS